jgi:hypothetical protein
MKKNNGFFKSAKHRDFLLSAAKNENAFRSNLIEDYQNFFGVTLADGEIPCNIDGIYRWADYGSRSEIPALNIFVLDQYGVKKHYKVGGHGNLRIGWGPDPKKCKLLWERARRRELPKFEEVVASQVSNKWLAQVGEKITVSATIKRINEFNTRFGYTALTSLQDDDGNAITVWKHLGDVGQKVTLTGRVKELSVFKERKQTVLTRVKVS